MLLKSHQEVLKNQVSNLTWQGKYWGPHGAIAKSRLLYKNKVILNDQHPLSSLSSTYYSAATSAYARAKQSGISKLFWYFRTFVCFRKCVKLSDLLVQRIGIKNLSADELDIRSTILLNDKRYKEALECSDEALSRPGISDGTLVLLEIGKGEVLHVLDEPFEASLAYVRAKLLYLRTDPKVQVMFLRSYAYHMKLMRQKIFAVSNLNKALEIAEDNDLTDQVTKIKFELAQYA